MILCEYMKTFLHIFNFFLIKKYFQVEKELADLSDPDFSDDEDGSVVGQVDQEIPIYQESTPYNSHHLPVPLPRQNIAYLPHKNVAHLPHENGQMGQSNEDVILHGSDGISFLNSLFHIFIAISFLEEITFTFKTVPKFINFVTLFL